MTAFALRPVARIVSLGCVFSALGAGCPAPKQPDAPAPTVLDDKSYRFCHIDGANAKEALAWCSLLDDLPADRCPGLRATCSGAVTEDPRGCSQPPAGVGEPGGIAGQPDRPPPEPMRCGEAPDLDGMQSLLRWIAAISVAALVLIVLRLAWASFARIRPKTEDKPLSLPLPIEVDSDTDVPDAPSADLLDAARRALAEGRGAESVLLARGAVLRKLGELGKIWLHRSRTDREYVRSLRSESAIHTELKEICRAAESVRWEGALIEPKRASDALEAAERLFALLRVALLLFAVGAGASISGEARAQGVGNPEYERFGPSGDAALLDVFILYGYDTGFRLTDLGAIDARTDVLVLDSTHVAPTDEQWTHIRSWVEEGGVLLVGGTPAALPELGAPVPSVLPLRLDDAFAAADLPLPRWPRDPLFAFEGAQGKAIVADAAGNSVVEMLDLGHGVVIAIADTSLLWNGAFVHPDNERFVGELLHTGQSLFGWPMGSPAASSPESISPAARPEPDADRGVARVQLATRAAVVSSDSGGNQTNNMSDALAASGLLLFVIQLIATGAIASLWRGWPFSPLRDPADSGRHAFVEHIRALGTRYWRMHATAHVERQFAGLWLLRLGVQGLQLAAQRAGYPPAEARAWAQEIEAIATAPVDRDPEQRGDLGRMEELWRITRTRR